MTALKLTLSVSCKGPQGRYTADIPGGLPRAQDYDEVAPTITIEAITMEELLLKAYMHILCVSVASENSLGEDFISAVKHYHARKPAL